MNWLRLPIQKQQELFQQLSFKTGIQPQAIEKDAWVTLVLRLVFNAEISEHLVFKGGTSLINKLNIIPPKDFLKKYKDDYLEMQENMIYGDSMTFKSLIDKIITKIPASNTR